MNEVYRYSQTLWTRLVVLSVASAATIAAAADIQLRERIVISSPVVRLGDVAEIVSADRAQARKLAALPLMPAPAVGSERFLRQREVQDLLAAHGQDLSDLRIAGAAQVGITAAGTKSDDRRTTNRQAALSTGQIHQPHALRQNAAKPNDPRDEFRCIVESYLNTKSDHPAAWRVSCEVAQRHLALIDTATSPPICRGGREPWTGQQRFVVSFETPQGIVDVPVYANVEDLSYPVVVAIRPIARGDVITAANVELQHIQSPPGATPRRAPVNAVEKIVGMEARQSIPEGQLIFTDQVQLPLMVKRGEVVTVTSQGGGIRVRTTARARHDGVRGELVQVESLESRERYDARVTGPNQAAVFAVSPPSETKLAGQTETAQRPIVPNR